jgi:hypothetical protein
MMNVTKTPITLLFGLLVCHAGHAAAQDAGNQKIGDSAQAWFALQAEGTAAGLVEPMSGAQASAAHARYLKSFDKPIPDSFGSSLKDGVTHGDANGG